MSRPFTIKPAAETIELDRQRGSEVVFTVSNASGRPIAARGRISCTDAAQKAWFKLQDEPERKLKVDETTQYKVKIAVPPNVAAGSYKLQFDVVEVDNEESFTEGSPVGFQVKTAPLPTPKKFPWWIVAVAAGVLLLVGVGITIFALSGGPKKGKMVELVGKDLDEARDWVKEAGLKLSVTPDFKDPNKANRVTHQKPDAGEDVVADETIVELVYEPPLRRIPDLKGKKATEATAALHDLGLEAAVTQQDKDRAKAGTIISQDPAPGQLTQEGSTVNLVAEKGRIQMPDVMLKSVEEAKKILADAKLTNVKVQPPDLFPAAMDNSVGLVGMQNQPKDTPVSEDDPILLTPIGRAVAVPNVGVGTKYEDAAKAIGAAKLSAVQSYETPTLDDTRLGRLNTVKRTVPSAGQRALEGSNVVVVVPGTGKPINWTLPAYSKLLQDPAIAPKTSISRTKSVRPQ
jgi:serine/threonine-protein kinase